MSPEPQPSRVGPGGGGDEEDLTPPTGLTLGPPHSSSEDEVDQTENFTFEYLPLSQEHDSEDDTEPGQNLSDLMMALAMHGPNVITETDNTEEEVGEAGGGDSGGGREGGGGGGREGVELEVSSQTAQLMQEYSCASEAEARQEQASLWLTSPPPTTTTDPLELDGGRVEEIKSAMASVTLPPSAIPAWAQNLSDEDWNHQIASLISKRTK